MYRLLLNAGSLLTCVGLVACSTSSTENAGAAAAAPTGKAEQLQKFIHRGTDVEITEKSGQVRRVRVTRIDDEMITGKTSEGRVEIPIENVQMAIVRKDGGGKPKQRDDRDSSRILRPVGHVLSDMLGGAVSALVYIAVH